MKNTKIISTSIVLFMMFFQSCFFDNKVQISKMDIEEQIQKQSKGDLELTSFEKVDGKESLNESYQYELEFKATMLIKNNCLWVIGSPSLMAYGMPFMTAKYDENSMNLSGYDENGNPLYKKSISNRKAGESVEFNGTVYLEKKESGWKVYQIQLEPINK